MTSLHDELIATLKLQTPAGASPVAMLMEALSIGKEAAYRRLRGEIQLTLEEAVILAKRMGVSLDNMVEMNWEDKYAFHITPFKPTSSMEEYYYTLKGIMYSYDYIKNDPDSCCYIMSRLISPSFYFKYSMFSRFMLLKWVYQVQNCTKYSRLSDVEVSPGFEQIYSPFRETSMQVPTTYVLSETMFTALANDLSYFYRIKSLTREEAGILRDEIIKIIDDIENVAVLGCYANGVPVSIYITDLYIDISYFYAEGNGFDSCAIGVYGLNFLSCLTPGIVATHKAWIDSVIKYSTSITRSGEALRIAFFNRQREKIENIKL